MQLTSSELSSGVARPQYRPHTGSESRHGWAHSSQALMEVLAWRAAPSCRRRPADKNARMCGRHTAEAGPCKPSRALGMPGIPAAESSCANVSSARLLRALAARYLPGNRTVFPPWEDLRVGGATCKGSSRCDVPDWEADRLVRQQLGRLCMWGRKCESRGLAPALPSLSNVTMLVPPYASLPFGLHGG